MQNEFCPIRVFAGPTTNMRFVRRVKKVAARAAAALAIVLTASIALVACRSPESHACRDYLDRFDACVARMDPTARRVLQAHLAHQREELARLSKSADSRATIERECAASLHAIAATCPR